MKKLLVVLAGVLFAASANAATLRLYFSERGPGAPGTGDDATAGADVPYSPPLEAVGDTNPGPFDLTMGNKTLYIWAEMIGGGTQKWAGVGLQVTTTGGVTIAGFNFWNYTNGGGFTRWDGTGVNSSSATEVDVILAAVSNAGVNSATNTTANAGPDFQYINNGSTNRHVVIGSIEFAGTNVGDAYLGVGNSGIARDTGAVEKIYLGHGDEGSFRLGNSKNQTSPIADATFTPEPASLILLGLAGLMLRRR